MPDDATRPFASDDTASNEDRRGRGRRDVVAHLTHQGGCGKESKYDKDPPGQRSGCVHLFSSDSSLQQLEPARTPCHHFFTSLGRRGIRACSALRVPPELQAKAEARPSGPASARLC